MIKYIVNDKSSKYIDDYLNNPTQSLGLVGQRWLNKAEIAKDIASKLLKLDNHGLSNYPYILIVGDPESKSIGIDEVRKINAFIRLKVPIDQQINRIVLIENANLMTIEAQNALLKALEEPPIGTVFILTAISIKSLLTTIVSRLHVINILKPTKSNVLEYYRQLGHENSEVEQAYLISGGLPGIMGLMLNDDDHPLNTATKKARALLSGTTFDRLNSINDLIKNKDELKNVLFIIKQMAKIGLGSTDPDSAKRWRKILNACLESESKLQANAQTKLLLTNFVLSIG